MTIKSRKFSSLGLIGALLVILAPSVLALTPNEVAKLTASDGTVEDLFGSSVAVDGNTALIGAQGDDDAGLGSGSAYVFTRSAGVWTEQAKLTASDGARGSLFGVSVALDGNTALIGAAFEDNAGPDSGSAYVFKHSAGVWTEQAKLTASDGAAYDQFGLSVALDGDTALISANWDDDNGVNSGSAYVFTRSAGVWTEQAKLTASDGARDDHFGDSVAVDGYTALIGAGGDDNNADFNTGSAYVFTRSAGVWTEQAKLTASDGIELDEFGRSVALDGNTALIGALLDDDNGFNSGSAYVFTRSAGVWTEQAKLIASDGIAFDLFGQSVALDGNMALFGKTRDDDAGLRAGSAYVFTRSAGVWTEQAKLTASDGARDDAFGDSVAVDGYTALIGAAGVDDNGANSGSAYVFSLVSDITIDIKPSKKPVDNVINFKKNRNLKVAILGDAVFDALQVDPETVAFGPSEASPVRFKGKDYNKDGFYDLILTFKLNQTGIACGDTEATLTGETYSGEAIEGSDNFTVEPCHSRWPRAHERGKRSPLVGLVRND